jgi:RNA polymerase sigma-70 factor (ECF subfamily)
LVEVSGVMPSALDDATDFELLQLASGDERAFAVFYGRYERLVAGWLVRRTSDPQSAADLTAEVFAAAYLAAPRFRRGPEPAGAWLLGIARNKLLRSLRGNRIEATAREKLAIDRIELSEQSFAALQNLVDTPVLDLLADLPHDQRDAVHARVIEELGYEELAARAQISPTVARKRVSRGLAALRRRVEEKGEVDDAST